MCRLLGVVARRPGPLGELLAEEIPEFVALSREHGDGWGVASWSGTAPAVARDVDAAHRSARFDMVQRTTTDAGLLHIRMASAGSPLTAQNTHPFTGQRMAFAHNGFFSPRDALDELIPADLLATATGDTDSERYFLLLRGLLREHEPAAALALAAERIRLRATAFASLNCLLLTDDALYAYSEQDLDSEVTRRRGPDFFRLRYQVTDERVVVGSSGMPNAQQGWTELPERHVLEIRRGDLRVTVHPTAPQVAAAS
ncbi:class II glutamine amidotransferase [Saccharopolyspora sp. NFXS83]|uniref:class II glutamine amidotransferase n=1 Tax=Saccharopolyspora sp. NFXS83 TaxID=2993560 RepID=UPI00224AAC04|nr:class II glutamine amidotransferase [Saccharopolyspora sp. NFXS83]MCX2730102.1 class II glutamine amidotransferase [Saccharopolyspora sp. NFXS83]